MKNILILSKVETFEAAKNLKLIWLTVFFTILGVTQPLIDRYMETILQNFGGVDGIMLDPNTPEPQSNEVLLATFSGQFNQIGLIVLIISFMGMITAEKNSGVLGFIFTRPVSNFEYIISKLLSNWIISMICISIGAVVSYLYTVYLFNDYSITNFLVYLFFYSIWILCVVSITVLLSAFINSSIFVAVMTIVISIILMLLAGINDKLTFFLPSSSLTLAENQLIEGANSSIMMLIAPILFITINLLIATSLIRKF